MTAGQNARAVPPRNGPFPLRGRRGGAFVPQRLPGTGWRGMCAEVPARRTVCALAAAAPRAPLLEQYHVIKSFLSR